MYVFVSMIRVYESVCECVCVCECAYHVRAYTHALACACAVMPLVTPRVAVHHARGTTYVELW